MLTAWHDKGRVRNSVQDSNAAVAVCESGSAEIMKRDSEREILLTYLVARFVRFLQPHPPLIVQFDWHAAAAVRVLADPAEELLEFPPQGGVLLTGFRITRAALQPLWEGRGVRGGGGGGETKERVWVKKGGGKSEEGGWENSIKVIVRTRVSTRWCIHTCTGCSACSVWAEMWLTCFWHFFNNYGSMQSTFSQKTKIKMNSKLIKKKNTKATDTFTLLINICCALASNYHFPFWLIDLFDYYCLICFNCVGFFCFVFFYSHVPRHLWKAVLILVK